MDLGIIGLERSGKTTLFDAVTRGHASAGSFASAEPNIGVVKIQDGRLDRLSEVLKPAKITYAEARYLDFPGGLAVRGEGPSAAYMSSLAQCDALVHVVRAFRSDSVPHPQDSIDPNRDIEAVNLELAFADVAMLKNIDTRLTTAARSERAGDRDSRELGLVQRLRAALEQEQPIRAQEISPDERKLTNGYQLLTDKPLLIVLNIDEADIEQSGQIEADSAERWRGPGVEVAALSSKIEQELTELSDEEAAEFRQDMGLEAGGIERVLRLAHQVLGLISIFTVGDTEGRAWSVRAGSTAPQVGGKIHSDIERGFIRAEVIGWEEMVESGSWSEARKRGVLRTEGKQYIPQDGDLMHVLFNV